MCDVYMNECMFVCVFKCEMGMMYGVWCCYVWLLLSLLCFVVGMLIFEFVFEYGYDSFSVFVVMFCKVFGVVLSEYFWWC